MVVSRLNNSVVPTGSINWEDLEIRLNVEKEEITGEVELKDLIFEGDEYTLCKKWIDNGLNGYEGINRGMPYNLSFTDFNENYEIFNGFLDFKAKFNQDDDACRIVTEARQKDNVDTFSKRISKLTYGPLEEKGVFQQGDFFDLPWIVEKYENGAELAILSLTFFLTLKETVETVKRGVERITDAIKASTPNVGVPPSFDTGDIISLVILTAIDLTYSILMILYLKDLAIEILDHIYSPVRTHSVAYFGTLLKRAIESEGYEFEDNIPELWDTVFLPSTPDEKNASGIPRDNDIGYFVIDMIDICKNLFNAKIAVNGNKVIFRSENDPFWTNKSTYVLPDKFIPTKSWNMNDLKGSTILNFITDVSDAWTDLDYTGTSYSVEVSSISEDGEDLLSGFTRIPFDLALGSRKNSLTDFEKFLKSVLKAIDKVINVLGGKSNLASKVENRIGLLRKENRTHNIPKALRVSGGKLVEREKWSSKYLYDTYHNYKSFVINDFGYQRRIVQDFEIPNFCLKDFVALQENTYFETYDGKTAKIIDLIWTPHQDKAVASFWIQEVKDKNLKEEYYEQAA